MSRPGNLSDEAPRRIMRRRPSGITARHWVVLVCACTIMMGNYYCYDIPAALNVPLQKWLGTEYGEYQYQINLLYSVYSLPNIFLPLFGGMLVDSVGPTFTLLGFSSLVCLGQFLFALGIALKHFQLMLVGRVVFGLGGESLEVAQARITTDWFKGRALAFALGLNLSFARVATALNDNLSPWLVGPADENEESKRGMVWSLVNKAVEFGGMLRDGLSRTPVAGWFGLGVCLLSFACSAALVYLDRPASRIAAGVAVDNADDCDEENQKISNAVISHDDMDADNDGRSVLFHVEDQDVDEEDSIEEESSRPLLSVPESMSATTSSSTYVGVPGKKQYLQLALKVSRNEFIGETEGSSDENDSYASEEYDVEDETVHLRCGFSLSFWLLCLTTIALYATAVPFFHICTDYFQQKWFPGDYQTAGLVMSIPDLISAVGSPLCGILVDRHGHRSTVLPLAGLMLFATHALLCFTTLTPFFSMTVLGIAYSVFASALWPCVPYLVGRHQIATAYGFMTVSLNFSLFVFPLVVARIRNTDEASSDPADFTNVEYFFMGMSLIATALAVLLNVCDWAWNDGVLAKVQQTYSGDGTDSNDVITGPGDVDSLEYLIEAESVHETALASPQDEEEPSSPRGPSRAASKRRRKVRVDQLTSFHDLLEDDWTVKVVGEGIAVPVPHTYVHHHHHIVHSRSGSGRPGRSVSPVRYGDSDSPPRRSPVIAAVCPDCPETTQSPQCGSPRSGGRTTAVNFQYHLGVPAMHYMDTSVHAGSVGRVHNYTLRQRSRSRSPVRDRGSGSEASHENR
ncbi:major facilitator superfamily domain-containing protein [Cladochytrium replicatum]|nr:major facilitator superfamily domain-containing protein [Cladochytrium replicatum]